MRATAPTARNATPGRTFRPGRRLSAGLAAALLLTLSSGCKSTKTNPPPAGDIMAKGKGDPLREGVRIPAQNVPTVPDTGIGSRGGREDPLKYLGAPTGRAGERSGWIKGGTDPDRLKGTYLPDDKSTPAALAGGLGENLSDLRIGGDPRAPKPKSGPVTLVPAGGVLPPTTDPLGREAPTAAATGAASGELAALGVRASDFAVSRSGNGEFVATAMVAIKDSDAQRKYTGVGATQDEALKQLAELIRSDR